MDLQGVGAIFEVVGVRKRLARQLPRLANGNQPRVDFQGQRGSENKAPGLGRGDQVDPLPAKRLGQLPDRLLKRRRRLKQRSNVAKQNPRLGKIGNIANEISQIQGGSCDMGGAFGKVMRK